MEDNYMCAVFLGVCFIHFNSFWQFLFMMHSPFHEDFDDDMNFKAQMCN